MVSSTKSFSTFFIVSLTGNAQTDASCCFALFIHFNISEFLTNGLQPLCIKTMPLLLISFNPLNTESCLLGPPSTILVILLKLYFCFI